MSTAPQNQMALVCQDAASRSRVISPLPPHRVKPVRDLVEGLNWIVLVEATVWSEGQLRRVVSGAGH